MNGRPLEAGLCCVGHVDAAQHVGLVFEDVTILQQGLAISNGGRGVWASRGWGGLPLRLHRVGANDRTTGGYKQRFGFAANALMWRLLAF